MQYVSLYRKWRPQTFEQVVGQSHVTRTLANAISSGRVSHAYLFSGPRGTGKTSVAKILSKALNCAKGPTTEPCNECDICKAINGGFSIDVREIDAASNRGIDDVRELREKVYLSPSEGRQKVYIIDEVHMLTTEASNALLKILEEPPKDIVFVFATTEPHKILPTMLSRCQRFDFRRIGLNDLIARLELVAADEKIDIEPEALRLVARHAEGSLRDALGLLEQLSAFATRSVDADDVVSILGLFGAEVPARFMDAFAAGDLGGCLGLIDSLAAEGKDLRKFTETLLAYLRDLRLVQLVPDDAAGMIGRDGEILNALTAQGEAIAPERVVELVRVLGQVFTESRWQNPRLLLEMATVQLVGARQSGVEVREVRAEARRGVREAPVRAEARREVREAPRARKQHAEAPKEHAETLKQAEKEVEAAETARPKQAEKVDATETAPPKQAEKEVSAAEVEKPAAAEEAESPTLAEIIETWPKVLASVKKRRPAAHALLLECHPRGLEDGRLVLEFETGSAFQKERIEKTGGLQLVKDGLAETLDLEAEVVCVLSEAEQPEQARASSASAEAEESSASAQSGASSASAQTEESRTAGAPDAGNKVLVMEGEEGELEPDEYEELTGVKLVQEFFGAKIVEEIPLDEGGLAE